MTPQNILQQFGPREAMGVGDLGEFRDLLALVQRSGLKPVVDSEYALEDVHGALDRLESGRQFGKVVINIGSDA